MATPSSTTALFQSPLVQLDVAALLTASQINDRLTEAKITKTQPFNFAPAKASSLPSTVSANIPGGSRQNRILGTLGDDDITGTSRRDFINGRPGNDLMRGANGDDVVVGGLGNDTISGDHVVSQTTRSNDQLAGGPGQDKLFGRIGNDILIGGDGDDQLFGGSSSDRLIGGAGDDQLFGGIVSGDQSFNPFADGRDFLTGGSGDDFLDGGDGIDVINGTDGFARGSGEVDLLTGGGGRDLFVLGSRATAYYKDGGAEEDFAFINDFTFSDWIRLHGDASQYDLDYDPGSNSSLIYYTGESDFELIAILDGVNISNLSLNSNVFQYVA